MKQLLGLVATLAIVVVVAMVVTGEWDKQLRRSPQITVQLAYWSANKGKYSIVARCMDSETFKRLGDDTSRRYAALISIWRERTRNRTIKSIDVIDESIHGEWATVQLVVTYENKLNQLELIRKETLVKKGEQWKIVLTE